MAYWLMKSEPDVYSIDDLQRDQTELWDGVRNYQARNFLTSMALGDLAFFYHSNTKPPGIVGLMKIVETNVVDPTQFDPASPYYDPKSPPEQPRWRTVVVGYGETFDTIITLDQLKATFTPEDLWVVRRGNRLSVMPVAEAVAQRLLAMAHQGH
ncbi:MAG TPA: EVE domain-containing protein [Leptolyngbyaceae cyanobacterium M65_K2018_010]|nr:EVE domain-containing protein [Leptolyngbyaceae cyanobacterium M65_K2018_010]